MTRRFRMMMRHTWLISLAAILLCAGIVALVYHFLSLPTHLRMAVGPTNSEDVKVIQAITTQLKATRASVRLDTTVMDGGTRAAAAAIDAGKADLAVVRRDTGLPRDGQAVAILRKNVAIFIVPGAPDAAKPAAAAAKTKPKGKAAAKTAKVEPKSEPIEKIEELVGKRLGVVGRSPTNIDLLKVVLRQYHIDPDKTLVMLSSEDEGKPNAKDKISIVQFDPSNVSAAIRESNVDVILTVGPVGSAITSDAVSAARRGKEPPTFIAISAAEAIAERNPIYESTEIKAGAFGGSPPRPEESVDTIGVNHYIVARSKLGEQLVADFTKQLFAVRQTLTTELPAAARIEKPDTDKDAQVTVHPGAAAYLDGELKTFFDRYSDLLYWGVMLLSFFGSGLAGLATYSKADDRARRLGSLERLVEITKAARTADTIQSVDELQAETDQIFGNMVHEVEGNSLDEAALMAFSVSLDQAQLALSDRRAALVGHPPLPRAVVA